MLAAQSPSPRLFLLSIVSLAALASALASSSVSSFSSSYPVPADWRAAVAQSDMLYFGGDDSALSPPLYAASIGNGHLATVLGATEFRVAGVFSGLGSTTPSHRAALPALWPQVVAPLNASASSASSAAEPDTVLQPLCAALDMQRGVYLRRMRATSRATGATAIVEQRLYAHRARPTLLVVELEVLEAPPAFSFALSLSATTMNANASANDAVFVDATAGSGAPPGFVAALGTVTVAETPATARTRIGIVYARAPASIVLSSGSASSGRYTLLTAVCTTLNDTAGDPVAAAVADMAAANAAMGADGRALLVEHVDAWAALNHAGVSLPDGSRADVARAINASLYYLRSSMREDRPYSLSPGGLAGGGYEGVRDFSTDIENCVPHC
jgi:hypothetical protein